LRMAVRLPFVNVTLSPHRLWNTAAIVNLLSPPLFIIPTVTHRACVNPHHAIFALCV
jgi:hypothetical protein